MFDLFSDLKLEIQKLAKKTESKLLNKTIS